MLFHSFDFVFLFLPIAIAGFFVCARFLGQKPALIFLLLCSTYFYGSWNPVYLLLLYGSIIGNFLASRVLVSARHAGARRRGALFLGVFTAVNLAVLGYFKYFNFFVENANFVIGSSFVDERIILPLAISFFTFQQIAFLVDVHRGLAKGHSVLEYALFVSFFPQLIAGPIVHHSEIIPQLYRPATFRFNPTQFADGFSIFLLGMFKKIALADGLESYANEVFDAAQAGAEISFFAAWGGTLAFSFQIYFDFSAYSDMAIGLARIFGIQLPINFNAPYKAASIAEFWRRWHMTLSRFLRDYLYIALGGNRRGETRRHANLMITMVLGGLWHGAAWTFVAWGALHGFYLIINQVWQYGRNRLTLGETGPIGRSIGWAMTFLAVTVAWVFFRADSFAAAAALIEGMVGLNGVYLPSGVIAEAPFLGHLAEPKAVVPFLAGGTLIGSMKLTILLMVSFGIVLIGRPLDQISLRSRLMLLMPTAAFCLQSLLYGPEPRAFLYFQF